MGVLIFVQKNRQRSDMGKSLLILGAGGHGRVIEETVVAIKDEKGENVYGKIDFLDDQSERAVGRLSDLERIGCNYDEVFCGIGNNQIRESLQKKAEAGGYVIPVLIHPRAYVSPSASIGRGTIIEPGALVNANAVIGEGCIISVGSIVDHDVTVEAYAHVNAGAVCKAGSRVEKGQKIDTGVSVENK